MTEEVVFKVGGVVRLKSYSPKMTIAEIEENGGRARCVWSDGKKKCEAWYDLVVLKPEKALEP